MRYCTNCQHLTIGTPLFCESCGRSFDVRLCPRLHPNPRRAEVCSQCGSRDLSQPQPRTSWSMRLFTTVLGFVPGIALLAMSVVLLLGFLHAVLVDPDVLGQLLPLLLMLGVFWWVYTHLPHPLQRLMQWPIRRMRGRERGHDRH